MGVILITLFFSFLDSVYQAFEQSENRTVQGEKQTLNKTKETILNYTKCCI